MIAIPQELKDFAQWFNPSNLRAFNKLEVIQLGLKAAKTKAPSIDSSVILKLSNGLQGDEKSLGVFVLRLYFYQIFYLPAFSLDLRRTHFQFTDSWHFSGEKLGHHFSESFRLGLQKTYRAYYLKQGDGMRESLEELKLFAPDWSDEQKVCLINLFLKHFKSGAEHPIHFKVSDMLDSFGNIFFFIKDNGGKVPSEFALLGIYLASLYLTLENTGHTYNVSDAFNFVIQLQSASG